MTRMDYAAIASEYVELIEDDMESFYPVCNVASGMDVKFGKVSPGNPAHAAMVSQLHGKMTTAWLEAPHGRTVLEQVEKFFEGTPKQQHREFMVLFILRILSQKVAKLIEDFFDF